MGDLANLDNRSCVQQFTFLLLLTNSRIINDLDKKFDVNFFLFIDETTVCISAHMKIFTLNFSVLET